MIPGYDIYKTMFECFNNYNRAPHDRAFPHKCIGHKTSGEHCSVNDFVFACILQNTFNVYTDTSENPSILGDFKTKC